MPTVTSDPSVLNPTEFTAAFEADMAAVEREIESRRLADEAERDAEMLRLQREDEGHCRRCGDLTEGAEILGTHVHVCRSCLVQFVATNGWQAPEPKIPKFMTMFVAR